jgi:hypothetical protein
MVQHMTLSPPGTVAKMLYQNQEGQTTQRTVEVLRWSRSSHGVTYLRAWCRLRNEERTFRTDRIISWDAREEERSQKRVEEFDLSGGVQREWSPAAFPTAKAPSPAPAPLPVPAMTVAAPAARVRGSGFGSFLGAAAAIAVIAGIFKMASPSPALYKIPLAPTVWVAPAQVTPAQVPPARVAPAQVARAPAKTMVRPAKVLPATMAVNQRRTRFTSKTQISSTRLFELYESADANRNDLISMQEISAFQSRLFRTYKYLSNSTALAPDLFLQAGGGDCEDWALVTAGLLRYWGFTSWVVSFGPEYGGGHAMCFLQLTEAPEGYGSITLDAPLDLRGQTLPAGTYVPIDYDELGSFSNAVEEGWKLRGAWVPEELYGQVM